MKYHPESKSLLSHKQSHFNSKKIMGMCEKCGKPGKEVHHLIHQNSANDDNIVVSKIVGSFHKNNLANLITLCEKCHDEYHVSNIQHKKVKTSKGYKVKAVSEN